MRKKGLSPVIATVLLISIVIVIGLIVFLWFKGITEEAITKFDGTNVKLVCQEVSFEGDYDSNWVYITNTGNVPIYRMKAKIKTDGGYSTELLPPENEGGTWPDTGLNQGGAYSGQVTTSGTSMLLIPVLIGQTSEGEKAYTCDESHGLELEM